METRDDDHGEFNNDGPWPRRLFHVPTMTSLKWQPGNVYGCQKEPSYHALSYTWGRWHLQKPQDLPDVHALTVHNVFLENPSD